MDESGAENLAPSPAEPVPDRFDLICEGCSYSLVGLIHTNLCPECGLAFDPMQLPLARVPWLFRKRRGVVSAYIQTVRDILFSPKTFATELCRPIRICWRDAQLFRRVTIRIAVVAILLTALALTATVIAGSLGVGGTVNSIPIILALGIRAGIATIGVAVGAWLMLTLGTDLPTFIWKGFDESPDQLAPAHHYASAPLALLPIAAILFGLAGVAASVLIHGPGARIMLMTILTCCLVILVLLCSTAAIFMRAATGCTNRRITLLMLYLPIHWLMMAILGAALAGITILVLNLTINALGFGIM